MTFGWLRWERWFYCAVFIHFFAQHECQHHHSKTKKHSKKSKKHHRKRSRSRSVRGPKWRRRELAVAECHQCSSLCWQGSESEEEDYHKKKKRSQSKSPSERSSSGESGEWPPQLRSHVWTLNVPCLWHVLTLPERSYKKSKKHKKKTKKRRHKSVSTQEMLWNTDVFGFVLTEIMTTRRLQTLTMRRKEESETGSAKRT